MAQSAGRWEGDTPFSDVKITLGPEAFMIGAQTWTITRNSVGDYSLNLGASLAGIIAASVSNIYERFGNLPDSYYNENYGTSTPGNAAGAGIATLTGNQGDPGGPLGRPPFTGATQLVPRTGFKKKGFKLTDVTFVYIIAGAALTAHTCRIDKFTTVNGQVISVTNILASGTNGLQTTSTGNVYVTKVPVGANADWNVTDNSDIVIEWAPTTQAGGSFRAYRMYLHGQYNLA